MEKSLGLFRIRPRKDKVTMNIYKNVSEKNDESVEDFLDAKVHQYADSNNCCVIQSKPFLMIPSMCSSFAIANQDERENCLHSTPCSFSRQFSPINWPCNDSYCRSSSSIESIDQISNPSTSSTMYSDRHIWQRRRLSFGATSSPTSISMSSSKFSQSSACQISANQVRYLEHINKIKKNIKLEVEMRSLREELARVETHRDTINMMPNKKRKLQHIFRLNLKKQLKEMKKSQNGIRKNYEIDSLFDDRNVEIKSKYLAYESKKNASNLTLPSKRIRFDGTECKCMECVH